MRVITSKLNGDMLTLTIDVSKAARDEAQPSGSGKNLTLATTSGFRQFDGGVSISLNATVPLPQGYKFPEGWTPKVVAKK